MKQVITALLILIYASTGVVKANDLLIFYTSNESSQYSNLKSEFESLGFTVTGSTSGSVTSTAVSGKELVIDITGSSNCGSTCKTTYESFIGAGGHVIIAAENGATNRLGNIEQLIESKLAVGAFNYYSSTCNDCYASNRKGDFASSTSSENTLPAVDTVIRVTDGSGTILADNYANQSSNYWSTWHQWGYGSNGGTITITFGYGQFLSTVTNSTNIDALLEAYAIELSLYTATVSITSSQTTTRTAAMNANIENGCNVCITQSGAGFTANIRQDGNDNFIVDKDWSGNATITGDNVTLDIKQGNVTTSGSSDENGLGLYINGDNTNLTVNQGDHANDQGEHRAIIDLNGNSNTVNLTQYDGGTLSKHFSFIDVDALSNTLTITQKDNGQKTIFLDINGNSNTGTFIQEDTGLHYLDVTLGSASHTVDITQRGSGNHAARVDLDGYSTDFDLIQQGNTAQSYNIDNTCSNALGCTINTTQGTQ